MFPLHVSGAEGKAGMAAVADPERSTDLEKFGKDLEKALPPYARPVFLRFLKEVNKTGGCSWSCIQYLLLMLYTEYTKHYGTPS